ncbi:MAG: LysM peptidoglycan-binding domain-containing protein [Firmicutes bacterium]|nr:LysM peptidoglycan-binding domain-containing protein [Bacillota bacterium]
MKKILFSVLCILVLSTSLVVAAQSPQHHSVVVGDTLRKIAARYDTTVLELLDLNPGITLDNLQIGQKIILPMQPLWSYHVVQPGDNASSLANQYKVPVEALREANGLTNNKLTVGKMIKIPMHLYERDSKPVTHKVEIGDTLYKIAQTYKVTLTQLTKWNNLEDLDNILAGQVLIVG